MEDEFTAFAKAKGMNLHQAQVHTAALLLPVIANDKSARTFFESWQVGRTTFCELLCDYIQSLKVHDTNNVLWLDYCRHATNDAARGSANQESTGL